MDQFLQCILTKKIYVKTLDKLWLKRSWERLLEEVLRASPGRRLEDVSWKRSRGRLIKRSLRLPFQTNLRRLWDQNQNVVTTFLQRVFVSWVVFFCYSGCISCNPSSYLNGEWNHVYRQCLVIWITTLRRLV